MLSFSLICYRIQSEFLIKEERHLSGSMRIMTFNIQHCLDYKRNKINIPLFADAIKEYGADVCGLNEVRGKGPLFGYSDQTNALGDRLGFRRYFAQAIKVGGTSPYGNAVVSRYAIKCAETVAIPDPDDKSEDGCFETRCALKAIIDVNGKDLCVLVCHMGLEYSERLNAVDTLCKLIDEIEMPLVLMGDFNTTPDSEELKPLYMRLKDIDDISEHKGIFTYPSYNPEKKIDYIFYRGMTCKKVSTITEVVSDHFPIIAEFEF